MSEKELERRIDVLLTAIEKAQFFYQLHKNRAERIRKGTAP